MPEYIPNTSNVQLSSPLTDFEYCYEITMAFSTTLYSHIECLNAINDAIKLLNKWLDHCPEVERTYYVIEYTKKLQPHVHIAVCCNDSLKPDFRAGVKQGLIRNFKDTRVTFSNVADKQAYNDYLEKDLYLNDNRNANYLHKLEFIF